MISLRLTRVGKKKRPMYRLIAIPKHRDPWGKNLEILGIIDPRTKERTLKADRIKYWLSVGAQPSKTVHNILISEGIMEGKKAAVTHLSKKRREKLNEKEQAAAEKKAAEAEAEKAKAEAAKAEAEAPAEAPAEEAAPEEAAPEAEAETPTETEETKESSEAGPGSAGEADPSEEASK